MTQFSHRYGPKLEIYDLLNAWRLDRLKSFHQNLGQFIASLEAGVQPGEEIHLRVEWGDGPELIVAEFARELSEEEIQTAQLLERRRQIHALEKQLERLKKL